MQELLSAHASWSTSIEDRICFEHCLSSTFVTYGNATSIHTNTIKGMEWRLRTLKYLARRRRKNLEAFCSWCWPLIRRPLRGNGIRLNYEPVLGFSFCQCCLLLVLTMGLSLPSSIAGLCRLVDVFEHSFVEASTDLVSYPKYIDSTSVLIPSNTILNLSCQFISLGANHTHVRF